MLAFEAIWVLTNKTLGLNIGWNLNRIGDAETAAIWEEAAK